MTREEAIKKLERLKNEFFEEYIDFDGTTSAYNLAIEALKQPERKKGKWLLEREPNGKPYCLHCSVCDSDFSRISVVSATPFCAWCGAKMEEEQ